MTTLIALLLALGFIFSPDEATPEVLEQYEWVIHEDLEVN